MPKLNLIASFYWLFLAQKVVSGDLYHKVGDEVLLKPDKSTVPDPITSILWKHGKNKVAEWDKGFGGLDIYGAFKDRTTQDQTTGELRISGLTKTDSGVYSVEINGKLLDNTYKISVIKEVLKPTITSSCNTNKTSCTLTCEGDTTDAEPVTYSWKVGEGLWEVIGKQLIVSKSDTGKSTNGYKYICKLKNSVSGEVSEPVGEVFGPEPSEVSVVGVVGVILVLVAIIIAGIWCVWKKKKGYPEDTWIYFLRMFCSRFCGSNDDTNTDVSVGPGGNDETKADVSVGPGDNDETKADVSVGPGGNDETKADVSVGPGGNDETKTDVSVGPGYNDETKTDVSVRPGGDLNAAEKGEASGEESKLLNEDRVNHHNDNGDGAEEDNSVL